MVRIGLALTGGLAPGEIVECVPLAEALGDELGRMEEGHGGGAESRPWPWYTPHGCRSQACAFPGGNEVQKLLSGHGATVIMVAYEQGDAVAMKFKILVDSEELGFHMPVNWHAKLGGNAPRPPGAVMVMHNDLVNIGSSSASPGRYKYAPKTPRQPHPIAGVNLSGRPGLDHHPGAARSRHALRGPAGRRGPPRKVQDGRWLGRFPSSTLRRGGAADVDVLFRVMAANVRPLT